jgi:hypothetical protein
LSIDFLEITVGSSAVNPPDSPLRGMLDPAWLCGIAALWYGLEADVGGAARTIKLAQVLAIVLS